MKLESNQGRWNLVRELVRPFSGISFIVVVVHSCKDAAGKDWGKEGIADHVEHVLEDIALLLVRLSLVAFCLERDLKDQLWHDKDTDEKYHDRNKILESDLDLPWQLDPVVDLLV